MLALYADNAKSLRSRSEGFCDFRHVIKNKKFVEGVTFLGACESRRREHEEFFSRKISVSVKSYAEKEFYIFNQIHFKKLSTHLREKILSDDFLYTIM